MNLNSIRVRMQLWHGLILVGVLVALAWVSYRSAYMQKMSAIDRELQRYSIGVGKSIDMFRPRRHDLPSEEEPEEGEYAKLHVQKQPSLDNVFTGGKYYYAIFSPDREARHLSRKAPQDIVLPVLEDWKGPSGGPVMRYRNIGNRREIIQRRRLGFYVVVGADMTEDMEAMRSFGWLIALIGLGIAAAATLVGWFITSRTLKPIQDIASTAERISEGNLDRRIKTDGMVVELEKMAEVLNASFDQLQSVIAKQNRFVADASHELRTPISIVLTQTQAALKKERSSLEYKQTVEACERAARRMSKLSESLLTLARLDAGEEKRTMGQVKMEGVVNEALEMLRPYAEEHGVKLHTELKPAALRANASQINQVIVNLVGNAIQYNHEGGNVTVLLYEDDSGIHLDVVDDGIGIDAEGCSQLFDRFFRVDKARTTKAGGAGLGLAIVDAILRAHGAEIAVESELGKGTAFRILFPQVV